MSNLAAAAQALIDLAALAEIARKNYDAIAERIKPLEAQFVQATTVEEAVVDAADALSSKLADIVTDAANDLLSVDPKELVEAITDWIDEEQQGEGEQRARAAA